MKNCTYCKHAKWDRTATGRLHPSGDGRCGWKVKLPLLPPSMSWGLGRSDPRPYGGHINRRQELKDHCPYFAMEEGK